MNVPKSCHFRIALCASLLLAAACARNDASTYVESAKGYIAKSDYKAAIIQLKNAIEKAPDDPQARFLLARSLLESQDPVGAETEVRKALELKYSPTDAYPLLARSMVAQGKFGAVVRELAAVKVDTTQGRADLGASLARANSALGNRKDAVIAIDAVLREVPTDARALVLKAQFTAQEGNAAEGAELIEKALAAAPGDQDALFAKAQLQLARGDRAGATTTLEKSIEAHPASRQARLALISLLVSGQNASAAQQQLVKLKAIAPGELGTVYSEALVALAKGDAPQARELVQKVLAVAPDNLQALYLSGLVDAQLKSYSSAEDSLRKVVAKLPDDIGTRKLLAMTYLRSGQPAAAIQTLEPALRRAGEDPELLRGMAEAYLASGNIAKGGEYYERANRIDKTSVEAKVRLAQVRLAAGESERAIKDLELLSQNDPAQYQSDLALIAAYMQRRDYDKALAAVAALEKKQPDNVVPRNLKGAVYMAKRDYKNARAAFDKALEAKRDDPTAAQSLSLLDIQEGKDADALKRYEVMLAADPKNEQLLLTLAQLTALTRGNPAESKAIIEKAIAANPGSSRARVELIGYYTRVNDTRAALAAAQAAQSSFPDDLTVLDALAAAQLAAGENNQAIATLIRAVQLQPGSGVALVRLAAVQFRTRDYAGAIESARKAIALQPELPQAWGILVNSQIMSGQAATAIADARKLQKEQPNRALGFAMEGEILATEKKWTEAAASLNEALKRQPIPALAATTYTILVNAGKAADAKAFADRWNREHPKDTAVSEVIAEQSLTRKDHSTAIVQYRAILAVNPENPIALNNLAWMLSEGGDPKAREYAERAYQLAPFNASVVDTLGWTLYKTGDTARGTQLLRLANNLAPGQPDIRLHYAQALVKNGDKEGAKRVLAAPLSEPAGSPSRAEAEKIIGAN